MTSSTKPETRNVSQCLQRRTEQRPQCTSWWSLDVWFPKCVRVQTDRQTANASITILRYPTDWVGLKRGNWRLIVLSHWPHVAQQVEQQVQQLVAQLVEQHVASVKALLSELLTNSVKLTYRMLIWAVGHFVGCRLYGGLIGCNNRCWIEALRMR